ncbi:MAG: hypothetical protein LBQ47_03785 [Endomicrobium sp.]|nr:hypothetical protein [Endomicrobium sp.]
MCAQIFYIDENGNSVITGKGLLPILKEAYLPRLLKREAQITDLIAVMTTKAAETQQTKY